jgi:hypothetical protein
MTSKHTQKKLKFSDRQTSKHTYYIPFCKTHNFLNNKYLEYHLKKLGIMPDKSINIINNQIKKYLKSIKKPANYYCSLNYKKDLPKFKPNIVGADIFFIKQLKVKQFYNYPKYLSDNLISEEIIKITDKKNILKYIENISPTLATKYIAKTFNIDDLEKYKFPKWYILRPVDSFAGNDIFYVNNESDLQSKINFYKKTRNYKGNLYSNNVIASEYISNPLLFHGKKFHLRCYFLISMTNNIVNSFLLKFTKILTAKEKFDMLDPFTVNKHDTHVNSTDDDYFFPKNFTSNNLGIDMDDFKMNTLWKHITKICKILARIFEDNKAYLLFPNVKNAYNLLGLDIMVRDDMTPVFIELNFDPGFNFYNIKNEILFSKKMYGWINDTVLEPLLKYNDPMLARKHPTYLKPF